MRLRLRIFGKQVVTDLQPNQTLQQTLEAELQRYTSWRCVVAAIMLLAIPGLYGCIAVDQPLKNEHERKVTDQSTGLIPTKRCDPRYPREAALGGITGFVKMEFSIDSFGKPYNIAVKESSPRGVFDASATRAIECWRYGNDKGTKSVTTTIEFTLG